MKHNKQTQTEEQQYPAKTPQKRRKNQLKLLNDYSLCLMEININQKRSDLQLLRLRAMNSESYDKAQKKRYFDIKSRKNYPQQQNEYFVNKQLDMWWTLMQPIAEDFRQMGHLDIAYALKTRTVVKTDITSLMAFSEGPLIGNQKIELKENQEKNQKRLYKLNEACTQVIKGVYQEQQSEYMNNFLSESSSQSSGYYF